MQHPKPAPSPVKTAAILVVGDELLSGKVEDKNTGPAARVLRAHGILLRRVVVIGDDVDEIANSVAELARSHDILLTSGGVGPTHDDKTLAGVAQAFGMQLIRCDELAAVLRNHYREACTENHLRMAYVPEGARLEHGTNSVWPAIRVDNTWVLPGVPEAFLRKLAILDEVLVRDPPFLSLAVFVSLEEPEIKDALDRVVSAHPCVSVGSYPDWNQPDYKTKITFDGLALDEVIRARDDFVGEVAGHVVRLQ